MAVRKLAHVETDEQRRIRDRAERARRAQPPRDPTGEHHAACAAIARASGRDVVDVLDTWDERAAVREWDGAMTRVDAERAAVDDVRDIYPPKQRTIL